jgi:DNA repair protein RadB
VVKLSAGSYDLNKWLYGGYDCDVITTLYGGPGSGKTNFCLQAAVSQAKKGEKVIYIDTEGGFSSERVKQLVEKGNGKEKISMKKVLENILVLKPTNFEEQKDSFVQLLANLKKHVSLVVVDGMTMLYRLDFAAAREKSIEEIQKINAELTRQMRTLAEISRKQNIPVVITNQVYRWEKDNNMVAGDILKYWSKCLIELTNEQGRRSVHLRKHRSLKEKSMGFQIWDGGIKKRGWI